MDDCEEKKWHVITNRQRWIYSCHIFQIFRTFINFHVYCNIMLVNIPVYVSVLAFFQHFNESFKKVIVADQAYDNVRDEA